MNTRRSKRLLKSLPANNTEERELACNGKKQKLEKRGKLAVNENELSTTRKHRNKVDKNFKSQNNYDSDSSDSSVDYMKSPQTIDLNSDFFKVDFRTGRQDTDFSVIENKILSDVKQLPTEGSSSSEESTEILHKDYIPIPVISTEFAKSENEKKSFDNENEMNNDEKTGRSKSRITKQSINSNRRKNQKGSSKIKPENENVEKMNISELLAIGETHGDKDFKNSDLPCASEEDVSDWEEVKTEEAKIIKQEKHSFPEEGVQITVDAPDLYNKRKKKGFDIVAYVKRRMNHVKKEQQILIHKVHLLCWFAHGLYLNTVLNSEELMGLSLSLIPSQHSYPNKVDIIYLKKIASWFIKTIPIVENASEKSSFVSIFASLQQQFEQGTAQSRRDFVLMFVCLLRSLGLVARLIISLQPLPLKTGNNEVSQIKEKLKETKGKQDKKLEKKKIEKKVLSPEKAKQLQKRVMSKEEAVKRIKSAAADEKIKPKAKKLRVTGAIENNETQKRTLRLRRSLKNKYKDETSSDEEHQERKVSITDMENDRIKIERISKDAGASSSKDKLQKTNVNETVHKKENVLSRKKSPKKTASSNTILSHERGVTTTNSLEENKFSGLSERISISSEKNNVEPHFVKGDDIAKKCKSAGNASVKMCPIKTLPARSKDKQKLKIKLKSESTCTSETSGDEFIPGSQNSKTSERGKKSNKKQTSKKHVSTKKLESDTDFENDLTSKMMTGKKNKATKNDIDRRVLSSDSEDSGELYSRNKTDFWTEVLVDSEDWIPVNVITGDVNCMEKLRKSATKPVTYIVAWNPDFSVKDVTQRYCTQFHSVTRKQRVNEEWWRETLFPFLSPNTARDKKEDENMQKQIQELPLPSSIAEYKNHPLYALKRHLLKFEAIYPPNAPTLGFVKGEAVYARECVYTLRSRDIWLKEAKVVRLGEQPYKIVKARPKWDRMSGKVITDMPLEIFGCWQVEDYVPPTAVDGKVPRNAYGNVELFKPSMLPKGTIHLQVPGLNRVAKKLQIDCAPAVVGFDFHCGSSHPTYDGFVVCEEFQDVLLDAWNRDQEEAERREQEKRDKRVYGNWRRLIKGLLIRERLKIKYAFGEEEASTSKGKKAKKNKPNSKKEDDGKDTE